MKVAETQQELEDCFRLLHDAYVARGYMAAAESGLRLTPFHALPTTTTVCALWDGCVVGTVSIVHEGVFGFALQASFDISALREQPGQIAEVSGLAIHPDFARQGDKILFPLMKFVYLYASRCSDTRHLVIAVHPDDMEFYEALLCFQRLPGGLVQHYPFANGAPAVVAALDLRAAVDWLRRAYGRRKDRKNLYRYLVTPQAQQICLPARRYYTTNDPVLTPAALDYFFNRCSRVFADLDARRRALLWSVYDLPEFHAVLPVLHDVASSPPSTRRHQRFALRCPAEFRLRSEGADRAIVFTVVEVSQSGFQAHSRLGIPTGAEGTVKVELGANESATLDARVMRHHPGENGDFYGFMLKDADDTWLRCVSALETGQVARDL